MIERATEEESRAEGQFFFIKFVLGNSPEALNAESEINQEIYECGVRVARAAGPLRSLRIDENQSHSVTINYWL
jgi:hypothetical protein